MVPEGQNTRLWLVSKHLHLRSGFTENRSCVHLPMEMGKDFAADFVYSDVVHCTIMQAIAHAKFASILVVGIEVVDCALLFPKCTRLNFCTSSTEEISRRPVPISWNRATI